MRRRSLLRRVAVGRAGATRIGVVFTLGRIDLIYCRIYMICAEVTLSVWADNPDAVAFYRHLGMRVQEYVFEDIL